MDRKIKMNRCAVLGCENTTSARHRFPNPKDDIYQRFFKWIALTGNPALLSVHPYYIYSGRRVCSDHFSDDKFYPSPSGKERRLKKNSIPDLLLPAPLIESHPSEKNGIPLCEEVCRLADEKAEEDSNLEKTKKRRVIGYRCESAGNTCKRPMLYGEQLGKHNIDTQEADFELTLTELKEEQEDLTTGELIELDEHSSDGSRLQASSKFYSSLFGDIPAECVVDCILTKSAHSTSADGITGVSPINAATCDNAIVPTEVPVVKLGHPSATTSVECPSASKNISFTSQNVPNEFPCHEDTILSIPDSSGSSHSAKVEVSKEATVMGTAEASPQGVEGGTELVASDPQEDSASDQDSVFSIEAPPSPSHRLTLAEKVVDGAVVEMMARSFFASSGSESLVFLTDPYYKYKLCRLCFTSGRRLTYIFGGDFKEFDLKGAVEDLLHFRVSKSDDYPQHICDHCLPKLVKFKRFKDQFLKEKELFDEELKKHNKRIDKGDTFPSQAVTQGDPIPESISNLPEDLSHLSVQREVCETFLDSTEATTDVAAAIALDQKPESHNDQTASKEATSNDDNISLQGDFDDDEHLVKDGLALDFLLEVFVTWKSEKGVPSLMTALKKGGIEGRLMDFFPPNKRTEENFKNVFEEKGLLDVVKLHKAQASQEAKRDLQKQLEEELGEGRPVKEVITEVREVATRNGIPEHEVTSLIWNVVMAQAEWNKKEELVGEQALKHLKQYTPLFAAFTSTSKSELTLMLRVQEYCYGNMNFMKVFHKIILLFYKTDVLSEEVILKWYKEGHSVKGKLMFLDQMKKFVEWLQNAEEESESGEDEDEEED